MKKTDRPATKENSLNDSKEPSINDEDGKCLGGHPVSHLRTTVVGAAETRKERYGCTAGSKGAAAGGATISHEDSYDEPQQHAGTSPRTKIAGATRIKMQGVQIKDFNYNRVNSKTRRSEQIDDLDEQLRQEQESSRRLRSAVAVMKRKLDAAEEGRRRSNGLERAFFSHLAEAEALVLQRDRLMAPGTNETRAECLEAARNEAHERLALVIRRELEENSAWRQHTWSEPEAVVPEKDKSRVDDVHHGISDSTRATKNITRTTPSLSTEWMQTAVDRHRQTTNQSVGHREEKGVSGSPTHPDLPYQLLLRPLAAHAEHDGKDEKEADSIATGTCCWESDAIMQAYRAAAAGTVRKLASALFGQELLAVEAAKASAAEREEILEERAQALFESQVSLQVEKDQLDDFKASLQVKVHEAEAQLENARKQHRQQQDLVRDAERIHSSLSWRILSMQVARDNLAEAVGERLRAIQAAVRRRVGFLPWAVERAVNDLVGLCSTPAPSAGDGANSENGDDKKGLRLLAGDGASGSISTSRSSSFQFPSK